MADKGDKPNVKQSGASKAEDSKLLEKVEITIKTYPDLQPFVEMAVLLLEGVYEHMSQVSALSDLEST